MKKQYGFGKMFVGITVGCFLLWVLMTLSGTRDTNVISSDPDVFDRLKAGETVGFKELRFAFLDPNATSLRLENKVQAGKITEEEWSRFRNMENYRVVYIGNQETSSTK